MLKADASDGGEGWSDSEIAAALETSVATVARTRQRLVEEGLEAALIRKHSPNSARRRIFDGAAEARLIALACSKPPIGRARWTLQLLEEAVVELKIVERASDNTIGRTLKKTLSSQRRLRGRHGRHLGGFINGRMTRTVPWSASTRPQSNSLPKRACRSRRNQDSPADMTTNIDATARLICS